MNYRPGQFPPKPPKSPISPSTLRSSASPVQVLENGFTAAESSLLHEAIQLSKMQWFDGKNVIMAKKEQFELSFRSGESQSSRWVVMAFPLYNMNEPNSAEICLHFLAEAHTMIHVLDFQYQVGINMETEYLEFLMQLPLSGVLAVQMAELIRVFFDALANSVMQELSEILDQMNA